MDFIDVIFPVNIGPLTYRCPEPYAESVRPGMLVSAPLRSKNTKGIVLGISPRIPSGKIKDIQEVHGNTFVLSNKMMSLLKWMSGYYLAEYGLVLKNMLPKEAFTKVKKRTGKPDRLTLHGDNRFEYVRDISHDDKDKTDEIIETIRNKTYRSFLLHAPSAFYEYSFLTHILYGTKNVLILIPEVAGVNNFYAFLAEKFGERVCVFHGDLSRGQRSEAIDRITSGVSDIIVGTRSAVFAPMKSVALIAVLHEHSVSYKQEGGICYNSRDVAVMRGYIEKATVLLSSICPSIESAYNSRTGKYTLLSPSVDAKKPKIKIIDMKYENRLRPYLSKKVFDAAQRHIRNDKKVMFVVNRRGHSTLQCTDCSHIEECPSCRIPLVLHKQDMSMKCHYCGHTMSKIPEHCSKCSGYNLKLLGAGTQRVQEDLEKLMGMKTLRLDSDRVKKKSELERLVGTMFLDDNRIFIGTKLMTHRLGTVRGFSMAAVLNTDLLLNIPDFRSAEKAYQEILSIADAIEPGGDIFIQTRMPQNYLFQCLKNYDHLSFFNEELGRRKMLCYPPFSRLLLIKFSSRRDLLTELSEIVKTTYNEVEIIGPFVSKNTKGENEFKVLMKSSVRGLLNAAAGNIMKAFKVSKDVKIKVDVDPVAI
jgi:primosomal protein N' (replication factor Y) (superfamily II helicase)